MRNVGAWKIFWHQQKKMHSFNVVSWNVMLNAYAVHGYGKNWFVNLGWMCQETVEIRVAMFVCIQTLRNHASLEDECLWDFDSMASIYIYLHYNWPSSLHTCSLWSWCGHDGVMFGNQDRHTSFQKWGHMKLVFWCQGPCWNRWPGPSWNYQILCKIIKIVSTNEKCCLCD
jgi:hypothetical protein